MHSTITSHMQKVGLSNGDVVARPERARVQLELQGRHDAADEHQGNPHRHRGRALHTMEQIFGAAGASVLLIVYGQPLFSVFLLLLSIYFAI